MDCTDLGLWLGAAQNLGLPTLAIVAAAFKGKDFMEGLAAIVAAFRGTWTRSK